MVPTLAHLFEPGDKIGLSREEYLVVQQIYRGWALFGPSSSWLSRRLVATKVVFWTFTFPANQVTQSLDRAAAFVSLALAASVRK